MKRATWQSLPPSHKAAIEASVLQKMFDTLPGALHEALEGFQDVRREQNGITEPAPGKCRAVWDALDAAQRTQPAPLTLQQGVEHQQHQSRVLPLGALPCWSPIAM